MDTNVLMTSLIESVAVVTNAINRHGPDLAIDAKIHNKSEAVLKLNTFVFIFCLQLEIISILLQSL